MSGRKSTIAGMLGCLVLISVGCGALLTSCSISDGGRTLVLMPDPFAKRQTGNMCIDSPVQAYIGGMACQEKLVVTASVANEPLPVIRGGCAMHYAILEGKPAIFEEFLAAGGKPGRCAGYPSSIHGAVSYVCRNNPALGHRFFGILGRYGALKDYPQVLMWHASLNKCVEGVQLALENGAGVTKPQGQDWDKGSIAGRTEHSPLEQALLHGRPGDPVGRVAIAKILVDAGASPWEVDARGVSLFARAEKEYSYDPVHWVELRAVLLRAQPENAPAGAGTRR